LCEFKESVLFFETGILRIKLNDLLAINLLCYKL